MRTHPTHGMRIPAALSGSAACFEAASDPVHAQSCYPWAFSSHLTLRGFAYRKSNRPGAFRIDLRMDDCPMQRTPTHIQPSRLALAVMVPLVLLAVAYVAGAISNALITIGPLDRAAFGWLVVAPLWCLTPGITGLYWARLSPTVRRLAAALICRHRDRSGWRGPGDEHHPDGMHARIRDRGPAAVVDRGSDLQRRSGRWGSVRGVGGNRCQRLVEASCRDLGRFSCARPFLHCIVRGAGDVRRHRLELRAWVRRRPIRAPSHPVAVSTTNQCHATPPASIRGHASIGSG